MATATRYAGHLQRKLGPSPVTGITCEDIGIGHWYIYLDTDPDILARCVCVCVCVCASDRQ